MEDSTKPDPPNRPRIISRRLWLLPALVIALAAVLPWMTDWFESGHLPRSPREFHTELYGSALTLLLGVWIVSLIRREQMTTLRHLEELERLTVTDPLTGLGNRRALHRDLPLTLSRSERLHEPLSLLYMDVNGLKLLNDRRGHGAGDETLRVLGAVLRSCSRQGTDTAYRVGGDECVMTLVADRPGAERLATRIQFEFKSRSPWGSALSVGVVEWDGQVSATVLMDRADDRMYQNKQGIWAEVEALAGIGA